MTDARARLAEIAERHGKATPGEWHSMREGNQYIGTKYMPTSKLVGASRIDGLPRPWNPHAAIAFGMTAEQNEASRFLDADADFIAYAHNHDIPYLLAQLTDAQARSWEDAEIMRRAAAQLEDKLVCCEPWLEDEGHHKRGCLVNKLRKRADELEGRTDG